MKKSAAIVFSLCTVAFAATANDANLLKNGNFARGKTNWVTVGTVAEEANGGVLTLGGKANRAISRQVIKVEEGATYKVSAKITSNKRVQILLGVIPMGRQNYEMYYRHSSGAKPETLTELAEAYVKGSNTVVLKDNPAWKNGNIVFNAKADMSDLPNFSYIPIVKGQIDGDKLILTLRRNLPRNYAVDTPVRFQIPHMGMYGGWSGKPAPAEWKKITWTVSGRAKISTNHALRWWQGADKGAIRIIANYNHQKNTVLQVRNVTMTITD